MKSIQLFLFCCFFTFQFTFSQSLFIGDGAEFYLKKDLPFTTSNTVVTLGGSGIFSVEAGTTWGTANEYVDGTVTAYGTGVTKLATGNSSVYAPVTADHSGAIFATYFNSAPDAGSNGTNVNAVSDVEYWELMGNAEITLPWNSASDITNLVNNNGGVLNSVAIVGLNSGTWDLVSAPMTNTVTGDLLNGTVTSDTANPVNLNNFTQFTFGIDNQVVLGTDDLFITNGIDILANPVRASEPIRFLSENNLQGLDAILYDITGKQVRFYNDVITFNGVGSLDKSNVMSGIYFLKFIHEGKQGVKKLILE
ncbi:MAG: T9SS type A sorting domain-containing protein [Flavobacteriaceae bacterium]|nr:T9SS type A sorting domain-containing protein [Flavobacteriaceae bacterium]